MDISKIFKAYDIRGQVPDHLNYDFARALGVACSEVFSPSRVIIGHDARLSSPELEKGLIHGLKKHNISIIRNGLCGTEEIYYACAFENFDLGIMITGSHNPARENGFKLVKRGAIPIGINSGLKEIEKKVKEIIAIEKALNSEKINSIGKINSVRNKYIDWLCHYSLKTLNFSLKKSAIKKNNFRVLIDCGNGCAGNLLETLAPALPFEIILHNAMPDGNFPYGVPNPLLPEKRKLTSKAILAAKADLGIAFDGDFDRCFFFDENGNFLDSYYLVGLFATVFLETRRGAKIVHDSRCYWNTRELAFAAGGQPVMSKAGHSFMKETMRRENAIYGGEMSAHHYFRDFSFCDSGILSMLTALSLMSHKEKSLAEMVYERCQAYPISGEINFKINNKHQVIERILERYADEAIYIDKLDGVNLEFRDWRFNLRQSNTENLLRLNVECRGNRQLLNDMAGEISLLCKDI